MTLRTSQTEKLQNGEANTVFASDIVSPLADTLVSEAKTLTSSLTHHAGRALSRKLHASASMLDQVASTLRSSQPADDDLVAPISKAAADYIEVSAEKIRHVDGDEALAAIAATARQHPLPLALGAAAAGFLAARFISSSTK